MSEPALSGEEMMAWNERTAQGWRKLVEAHPAILGLECDVYGVKTVAELLRHIVAVEMRYGQRIMRAEETPYEAIPYGSAEEIFGAHDAAMALLRLALGQCDWEEKLEFQTLTMGRMRASRKTIFFHALLHSIRHYAQLATLVRGKGFKPDWPMDYMLMGAERV